MCEICDQLKEMGRIEGRIEGKVEGRIEKATQVTINLLTRKLGTISEYIINKINNSNETTLDILVLNIFDIDKEEDILKFLY